MLQEVANGGQSFAANTNILLWSTHALRGRDRRFDDYSLPPESTRKENGVSSSVRRAMKTHTRLDKGAPLLACSTFATGWLRPKLIDRKKPRMA